MKLLEAGAVIDSTGQDGFTPLHFGAWYGRKDLTDRLLALGSALRGKPTREKRHCIWLLARAARI